MSSTHSTLKKLTTGKTAEKGQGSRKSKKLKTNDKPSDDPSPNLKSFKRKKGDSKFAKEVPFDVLLEICRYLQPIDLLHLSRVSKSMHDLLTSDDVGFLWKSVCFFGVCFFAHSINIFSKAYNNIPLSDRPPCPDDTNLVFYTNYVYGRHCQVRSHLI